MKVCFLINDLNTDSGWGRLSFDLIEAIKKQNIEVEVLMKEAGLLNRPFFNFFRIRSIIAKCDIIHALEAWPFGFYALIFNLGLNKKIIITAVGTYSVAPLYSAFKRNILKIVYLRASKVMAISSYTAKEINKVLPLLNIEVINLGVDIKKWSEKITSTFTAELKPYILSVGAVKFRKGLHNSIRAFAVISGKFPELKYVIAGAFKKDNYFNGLINMISDLKITEKVVFLNSVSDDKLKELYQNAELFVLTPVEQNHQFEGFGLVYLEAAAAGLPVIGSLNSGAEDALKSNFNGILAAQNNINAISAALEKMLGDENLKRGLGANSRLWASNFTWNKVASKYLEIYSK